MQTTLENKKKAVIDSPRIVFKRNNKVEEGRASCSRVNKEKDITYVRAQKMMRGNVEPFAMLIVVRAMLIVVQTTRQITKVPQMTIP
jgi:hypothetical protein